MSVRKILFTLCSGALLFVTSFAFAGGPMPAAEPPPPPVDYSGVYVDLSLGYAGVKWGDATFGVFNGYNSAIDGLTSTKQADGGLTFGGDAGYQINKYLGMELGWYYLPSVDGNSDVAAQLPEIRVQSWVAYLAFKVMAPIWGKLHLFGKVGGLYRSLRYKGIANTFSGFGGSTNQYWAVMFGAGLQYMLDQNWSISAQYLYFPEQVKNEKVTRQAPKAQLALFSVGYKFTL